MIADSELVRLAAKTAVLLRDADRRLVTAESCTGGWIGKVLTDIPGSSNWTLSAHGAASEAAAKEMAVGALEILGGHVALAVTGIAGPDGAQPGKPVGTVWFGWAWHDGDQIETRVACESFTGDREQVRRQTILRSLQELDDLIYP
jgi:nicotinamide-nucleotide amidase